MSIIATAHRTPRAVTALGVFVSIMLPAPRTAQDLSPIRIRTAVRHLRGTAARALAKIKPPRHGDTESLILRDFVSPWFKQFEGLSLEVVLWLLKIPPQAGLKFNWIPIV